MNFVLPVVLGLIGITLDLIGYLGLRGKMRRNRYFGVRSTAALRDDETFLLANRVAGLPNVVAGAVAIATGAAMLLIPAVAITVATVGTLGTAAITLAGGVLGHRAAEAIPEQETPEGCGTCACAGSCGILSKT